MSEDRLEKIKEDWDYDRDKDKTHVSTWEEKATIHWLISEVLRLNFENSVLRFYGNKDCTAMADERIADGGPIG